MKHTKEQVIRMIRSFRRQYAAGRLDAYQIRQLESIPGWQWALDASVAPGQSQKANK
jgi:hypothetical protein